MVVPAEARLAVITSSTPAVSMYLSWRLLKFDSSAVCFDVCHVLDETATKVNPQAITKATDFIDRGGILAVLFC